MILVEPRVVVFTTPWTKANRKCTNGSIFASIDKIHGADLESTTSRSFIYRIPIVN